MAKSRKKPAAVEEFHSRPIFHLAFAVSDLAATRDFYVDVLGCRVGRAAENWIDFDFFGYQITAHATADGAIRAANPVDGHAIPVPHFGLIMGWEDWHRAVDHMNYIGVRFRVAPHIRFKDLPGEQATFFLEDPSGNCLEFKAFRRPEEVFTPQ
ncbi:MAG: VOC family protein [Gammaproteobacteria bacterium]